MKKLCSRRHGGAGLSLALILLTVTGCATSLLGPEDTSYDDFCTVYLSEADAVSMTEALREVVTKEQMRRCRPLNVYIVKFAS